MIKILSNSNAIFDNHPFIPPPLIKLPSTPMHHDRARDKMRDNTRQGRHQHLFGQLNGGVRRVSTLMFIDVRPAVIE